MLLLPRQHAHALVHEVSVQVPAGGVSVRELVADNRARGKQDREYELFDTGVFNENRYFDVFVEYAKASVEDILVRVTAVNRGPEAAKLHLLPTVWFRNTWSWGGQETKPATATAFRPTP